MNYTKHAFYMRQSFAYGANTIIRYPNDRYDWIWLPITTNFWVLRNNAASINTTGKNGPPTKIFEAVVAPLGDATNLTFYTFPSSGAQIYISMYFTEVSNNLTGTRSFRLYKDGRAISNPIGSSFGSANSVSGLLNVANNTVFDLVPQIGSTLPPIISALEILQFSDELGDGTNSSDVEALSLLQRNFEVLQTWAGDPCLPVDYNWEWVRCSRNASPRISKLLLSGYGLSGDLPNFTALDALLTIDLQNNKLTGGIPEFLGNFPNLEVLNLADNDFSSVPTWLSRNSKILVNVTGNPKLCTPGQFCFLPDLSDGPDSLLGNAPAPSPNAAYGIPASEMLSYIAILVVICMKMM